MLLISYISIALKSFLKVDPFVTENLPPSTKKEGACLFPGKWWACQFPGRAVDRPEHSTATGITLACSLCPKAAALLEFPARVPERAVGWGLLHATHCNAELVGHKLVLCSFSACCGFVFWAARHLTTPTRDGTHAPAEKCGVLTTGLPGKFLIIVSLDTIRVQRWMETFRDFPSFTSLPSCLQIATRWPVKDPSPLTC